MPTDRGIAQCSMVRSSRGGLSRLGRYQRIGCAVVGFAAPLAAHAVGQFIPYASAQAEYNTNVFDLSGHQRALTLNGDSRLADIVQRYLAGFDTSMALGQQKLRATLEGRRVDFVHFSRLDHNEYLGAGGLDWRLGGALDGALDYRQEQRMASFADRSTTDLSLERERIGSGTFNVAINPHWRVESELRARQLDSPLPGFPDFRLDERSASSAIKYKVEQFISVGILGEYMTGRFENISNASRFHQTRLALVADYTISEFSRFNAELGYTRRRDEGGANSQQSEVTGALGYHRELSGKTSVDVRTFRRVASYVGSAGSIVETGAGGGLTWQPTEKIGVSGAYQWTKGEFPQSSVFPADQNRKDNTQLASVKLLYQATPWLLLRPYGGYQIRSSNVDTASYHSAIGGLELRIRFE